MSADPRSLAGIEGLLLKCSPVAMWWNINDGEPFIVRGTVVQMLDSPGDDERVLWWCPDPRIQLDNRASLFLEIDLLHKTGRCHAAWFVQDRYTDLPQGTLRLGDTDVVNCARRGCDLPPGGMERLRDLVLLAAGRTSAVATSPPSDR